MVGERNLASVITSGVIYLALALIAGVMLFPILYVIAVSFSSYQDFLAGKVVLIPQHFTLAAYRYVFSTHAISQSLAVSTFLATAGTLWNLIMTCTAAFALSSRHLVLRRFWFVYMMLGPLLFYPGMIPSFLVVKTVGLYDSVFAMIIPGSIGVFYMIVMRNFFMDVPQELVESAEIDGANELQILRHVILPLSASVLAAIGLFYAVAHWNSYFDAIIYLKSATLWPIQVVLRTIVLQGMMDAVLGTGFSAEADVVPPSEVIQMATVVVATAPILMVYPFVQKYFTKGMLTGAIKG